MYPPIGYNAWRKLQNINSKVATKKMFGLSVIRSGILVSVLTGKNTERNEMSIRNVTITLSGHLMLWEFTIILCPCWQKYLSSLP